MARYSRKRRYSGRRRKYRRRNGGRYLKRFRRTLRRLNIGPPEKKFVDTNYVNAIADYIQLTTLARSLNTIGQGDTSSTRDGDKVMQVSHLCRCFVERRDTTAPDSVTKQVIIFRLVVFVDKINTGPNPPMVQDVFQASNILAPLNMDSESRTRFKIIKDMFFHLGNQITNNNVSTVKFFKFYNKKKRVMTWNSNSITQTWPKCNGLWFFLLCDSLMASGSEPLFTMWNRIRYTDL